MQDQTIRAFLQYLKVGIFGLIRMRDLDLEIGWDIFVHYFKISWTLLYSSKTQLKI